MRLFGRAAGALLLTILWSGEAFAHASLIRSEPADRAVAAQAPRVVTLTFNEPVAPLVARLLTPAGETVALADVTARDQTLTIALPAEPLRGTYLLSWRVVSADGHPVGGALTFSVGAPSSAAPAPAPAAESRRLSAAIWAAKLVIYIGLFVGAGGAWWAPPSPGLRKCLVAALIGGLATAVVSVGVQGADLLDLPLSGVTQKPAWAAALATTSGLSAGLAALACLLGLLAFQTSMPRLFGALALAAVGLALSSTGHAASAQPELLTRPAVFLHAVAVAFWLGALLPLAAAPSGAALKQFSAAIPAAIAVLIASGITLAVVQLEEFSALWTTDYGRLLCAKLLLVLGLLAIAAGNRYVLTPPIVAGDPGAPRRLTVSIAVEVLLALAVLGLVAGWRFTPPPRALAAASAAPAFVHIHGDKLMAEVTIAPAGPITVAVLDAQFAPASAREVTVVLAKPEAGLEPLRLPARRREGAAWQTDDLPLRLAGSWLVRVEILVSDFEKVMLEDMISLR